MLHVRTLLSSETSPSVSSDKSTVGGALRNIHPNIMHIISAEWQLPVAPNHKVHT
jgi:hypothetical protein